MSIMLLGLFVVMVPSHAQEQPVPTFTVQDRDGTAIEIVTLRLPASNEAEPVDIFVTQTGTTAVDATLSATSGVAFAPATMTIPPAPARTKATLTATTGAQALEIVSIDLTLKGGATVPLLRAQIERESSLDLLNPSAEGVKEPAWPSRQFTAVMNLRSKGALPLVVTLGIHPLAIPGEPSTPLNVTANGHTITAGDTITLNPHGRLDVTLTADLLTAGTYTSRVEFRTGKGPATILTVPISVARSNVAPSLTFDAPAPTRVVKGDTAVVQLDGRETAGRSIKVKKFEVAVTRRSDSIGPHAVNGVVVKVTSVDGSDVTHGTTLAPNTTLRLEAHVSGLDDPGNYTASIRVTDSSDATLDVPFTASVKERRACAALAIGVGIVVAALIKWAGTKLLDRTRRNVQAKLLVNDINDVLDRFEPVPHPIDLAGRRMIQLLHVDVIDKDVGLLGGAAKNVAQSRIDVTTRHVELLTMLCTAWKVLARAGQDPSNHDAVKKARQLLAEGTDDSKREVDIAAGLRSVVSDARMRTTTQDINRIHKAITGVASDLGPQVTQDIERLLKEAEAEADPTLRQGKVAQAEDRAASKLLDQTKAAAEATTNPTVKKACQTAMAALPAGQPRTLDEVRAVQKAVFDALASSVGEVITTREGDAYKDTPDATVAATQRAAWKTAIALRATDPSGALAALNPVAEWASTLQGNLGLVQDLTAVLHLIPPPAATAADPLNPPPRKRESLDASLAAFAAIRLLVWVVVAAGTIALGLYALYESNVAWGGWNDAIVAVLWGAGVSASGVVAAAGVAGTTKSLGLGGSSAT